MTRSANNILCPICSLSLIVVLASVMSCSVSKRKTSDDDSQSDNDSETETITDIDTEKVSDSGSYTDTDVDTDADTDSDNSSDTDSDVDTDTDTSSCIHPEVNSDCDAGWCIIPQGCFIMGSPVTEPCRGKNTEIQVEVYITKPFSIMQTEVTRIDWTKAGFPDPSFGTQGLSSPVNEINWFDALAYCNAISKLDGLETCYDLSRCKGEVGTGCPDAKPGFTSCDEDDGAIICEGPVRKFKDPTQCPGYRLPTSAEWEYAARSGSKKATPNGTPETTSSSGCVSDPIVNPIAWHCGIADQPMFVGQKEPNGWGLYDMHGNVLEWTDHVYTGRSIVVDTGQEGPFIDPIGATESDDPRRSLRGGSFLQSPCTCKSAYSTGHFTTIRFQHFGFRPVRTIF